MTREKFCELLKERGIDESVIVFDDLTKDGCCVRRNYHRWVVCFRERGKEYECVGFPSESDALEFLCNKLKGLYAK